VIITRVPLRVSFVGGGSDLPSFYERDFGQVISMTVDKFLYVIVKRQLDIVGKKYRLNWSQVEFVDSIDEIQNPIIRETFRFLDIDFPCEVTTFSDIPGQTGMGSSSAFAVGLFQALKALKGELVSKEELARNAARIEIEKLKRPIGKQDHYSAAFGGMNVITFLSNGQTQVEPVLLGKEGARRLTDNLLLFYTNVTRDAGDILSEQVANIDSRFSQMREMRDLVPRFREAVSKMNLAEMGDLLDMNWQLKRRLTKNITNSDIDNWYATAVQAGALGGKLLGAGGGGFLMMLVDPKAKEKVIEALPDLRIVNCCFEPFGATITYYDH
jgi:D-glycero-alpha-D-manno-heptose-7-phosphate kinase